MIARDDLGEYHEVTATISRFQPSCCLPKQTAHAADCVQLGVKK